MTELNHQDAVERLWLGFENPGIEYTPVPFWFINDRPSAGETARQLKDFAAHGVHAVVLHPRIGIPDDIPYLSDVFMGHMGNAVREAARLGMQVMLYDEGMYPSGSACGLVVRENPRFAARALLLESGDYVFGELEEVLLRQCARFEGSRIDLATLKDYHGEPLPSGWRSFSLVHAPSGGTIRGIHFGSDDLEPGAPAAGDILNPDAVDCFIRLTHERYYACMGEYFGSTINAIFTDEPSPMGRNPRPGAQPFTWGFGQWLAGHGFALDRLPLLWFDGEGAEQARREYRQLVSLRLCETLYKKMYDCCDAHGISLAGHPMESDDITAYRYMHIPGQDVVYRHVCPERDTLCSAHGVMAKAASGIARQLGRGRNLNEVWGCCYRGGDPWDMPFADAKWMLDYLFARGCNLVVPHAFFYSVNGAGRYGERPPDVGPNSIWWPHFTAISRYISRMCYLNTGEYLPQVYVPCADGDVPAEEVKPLYETQRGFEYFDPHLSPASGPVFDGAADSVPRDLEIIEVVPALRVRRMTMEGAEYFVLVNEGEKALEFTVAVEEGQQFELWFPWEGGRWSAPICDEGVKVFLDVRQSAVLVPVERTVVPVYQERYAREQWWEETPIRAF